MLDHEVTPEAISEDDIAIEDLTAVLEICRRLRPAGRKRLIDTITTFFGVSPSAGFTEGRGVVPSHAAPASLSNSQPVRQELSAKEFVLQKQPRTGVERVACLAYYLTHFRDTPHFKTLDISKLNTDAAQPKFANAALAVNDAAKSGYIIPVSKGNKQLSAAGELFVQALPNRDEARAAMASAKPRKRNKRTQAGRPEREAIGASDE